MCYFVISLILLLLFYVYKSRQAMQMLQQNYYDESNRYLLWMTKNFSKIFGEIDLLFLTIIVFLFVHVNNEFIVVYFTVLYIIIFYLYYHRHKHDQKKLPLVITPRVKRLYGTQIILYLIICLLIIFNYVEDLVPLYYLMLGSITYLSYLMVLVCNFINKPIEKCVYLHYKTKALSKLKKLNIPVIGVTGSYGKTSCKNIINEILNVKFNSFTTPKNFNTAYGLIKTINNNLDKFNDLFIAEMGAFKRGEIAELCNLVHPKHGVLTCIGEAHLESFGSRENIQKGKFELIESLPDGGIAILNSDDEWQIKYKLKNKKIHVYWIGIDNKDADAVAQNICLSYSGTDFDVKFKDDEHIYHFHSHLLGKHNVYNLLSGILLGRKLGMTIEEITRGVSMVRAPEHRLELKRNGKLNIIDDAYNSNPTGSKMALDVLKLMPGMKVIVTPGMIELGSKQYEYNKRFGKQIAQVCDFVILVGEKQTKPIYDGLIESDYDMEKVFVLNDVLNAFKILNRIDDGNTYVLLENDLPDLFNE